MDIPEEAAYLARRGATLVLDVGANRGQTGQGFRRAGFAGRIVSFEPLADCFSDLAEAAATDPLWEVRNLALGAEPGKARIGVLENRVSSSLLPATEALVGIHAPVRYERHDEVEVARLDALFDGLAGPQDVVHLKIDTQGFERTVIAGAEGVLDRIDTIRMEVAVSEVYEGETTMPHMILAMEALGYVLVEGWPAWRHPVTREVLHFDLMFRRRTAAPVRIG